MSKSTLLLLSLCFAVFSQVEAQLVEIPLRFVNETPIGNSEFAFSVAAHPLGTDGLDTALKEREIPLMPPASVFYVASVPPTQEFMYLSPTDIRKLSAGVSVRTEYDVRVNWNGGELKCSMPITKPKEVDSVYITDGYTDFPNNIVKVKLGGSAVMKTDNTAITRFKILVWYNGIVTNVSENETPDHSQTMYPTTHLLRVSPNPASSVVEINGLALNMTNIRVYSVLGILMIDRKVARNAVVQLDVSQLPKGSYVVQSIGSSNSIYTSTFVKD